MTPALKITSTKLNVFLSSLLDNRFALQNPSIFDSIQFLQSDVEQLDLLLFLILISTEK